MTSPTEKLSKLVHRGAIADIRKAECAYETATAIVNHAREIRASPKSFEALFGILQDHARATAFLSLCRVYDKNRKSLPTHSLESLFRHLEELHDLPPISERGQLLRELERQGLPAEEARAAQAQDDHELRKRTLDFARERIESHRGPLDRLRYVRDKRIAHDGEIDLAYEVLWTDFLPLLELAKAIVALVCCAFLNIAVQSDGRYLLSTQAEGAGLAMKRLLEEARIVARPPRPPLLP